MKVIFDRDESKNDAGENEFFVNLETILLADGLWDIPAELSAKLLCNDSRKIRARAISNPISDLNALEKFIEEETCRNNLNEVVGQELFEKLSIHSLALLFNKSPEALLRASGSEVIAKKESELLPLIRNPEVRFWLSYLSSGGSEEDCFCEFRSKGVSWEPTKEDLDEIIRSVDKHGTRTEKQRLLEELLSNRNPYVRALALPYVRNSELLKNLLKDQFFFVREAALRTKAFAQGNFCAQELVEIIGNDPELAELVLDKVREKSVREELCDALSKSDVTEIRTLANGWEKIPEEKEDPFLEDILDSSEDFDDIGEDEENDDFDEEYVDEDEELEDPALEEDFWDELSDRKSVPFGGRSGRKPRS